ncbi:MAG: MFS transporter [Gemmatimonadaceae bacterium]|jgi:UMF1 family MFS transporter|nr:MFS transporter [Gemmatimonadaceae bacterium]
MTASAERAHARSAPRRGWLAALGLDRPELRAWTMYDFGVSAMQTTIATAVFPIFFVKVTGDGLSGPVASQWWGATNTIGAVLVALLAPVLGALADVRAAKKRFLAAFMLLGVGATAAMFLLQHGQIVLASVLFCLSVIGSTASMTFYESLLPHIAAPEEIDRVSTAGYAMGYIGGGVLLAINLAWILQPALFGLPSGDGLTRAQATLPTRLAFLSVAVWWLVFSLPVLRRVPEPARVFEADESRQEAPLRTAFTRLGETLRELRGYKQAFLMMVAFTVYNDGIQTIIRMASVYGTEIGIGQSDLITAILLVQFVGIPCAFVFGSLAGRLGAKRGIMLGLIVYTGICIYGYFMRTATQFYGLAILVGLVQGGTQALSRSLFASMVPKHKSGEFFGFFSVFEKFGGIFGPLLFSLAIGQTGSSRGAIISVIVFFAAGAWLLSRVDVEEGVRVARGADAQTRGA